MSCCDSVLNSSVQSNAVTEDCIIAYKIFDQCRKQICLTPCILGPARSSRASTACSEILQEGDIIVPPINAASVTMDDLSLCKRFQNRILGCGSKVCILLHTYVPRFRL